MTILDILGAEPQAGLTMEARSSRGISSDVSFGLSPRTHLWDV